MQTFKHIMSYLLINVFLFVFFTFIFAKPSVLKIELREAKESDYDTLVVGESLSETGVNPYLLDDAIGEKGFNLSRRIMPFAYIPYLVAEANDKNHYTTVLVDLSNYYWTIDHSGTGGEDVQLITKLSGLNLINFTSSILWTDNIFDVFCDYYLTKASLLRIPKVVEAKLNYEYLFSKPESIQRSYDALLDYGQSSFYEYKGRGFRAGLKHNEMEGTFEEFDADKVCQENYFAFNKLVEYCSDKNIELICFSSARPTYYIRQVNYENIHNFFQGICDYYGVQYYDMNYINSNYFNPSDDDFVDSDGHMTEELANEQTEMLIRIIRSDDKSIYLYNDYGSVCR